MSNRKKVCSKCGKIIGYTDKCICSTNKRIKIANINEKCFYSSYKWKKLRKQILERDNNICQRCLIVHGKIETDELQAHHIKSREHYPQFEYDRDNLITVCRYCNISLGIKDKLDFEWVNPDEETEYFL